jgi:NhaC family Na+:H+ antiporter
MTANKERKREISFGFAIIPMISMITVMALTIIKFGGDAQVPLLFGAAVAALIAWRFGFRWREIESAIYKGIHSALPAIIILLLVGMIVASWISGGIVPTMLYYGLMLISPTYFLVTISLICSIVSLATGTSWGTLGTIGIAGMGIGESMGIPAPMTAGAVVAGAYFGDKMSPLSDSTNLASGTVGADLYEHIKHMIYTTIPAFVIGLGVYWYLGFGFTSNVINNDNIKSVMNTLESHFMISPWLLLIPLVTILLVALKFPILPSLVVGVVLGFLADIFIQGGAVGAAVNALQGGPEIITGNAMVDGLMNRGGIESMLYTISIILCALTFAGIMEHTGMLNKVVEPVIKKVKTAKGLLTTSVVSAFLTNVVTAEMYMSIVLPGRMYAKKTRELKLHPKNLSRTLEDGGTLTGALVPWSAEAIFIFATLGVSAFQYAPFAILNYLSPIISIIFAWTGITIVYMSQKEIEETEEIEELDQSKGSQVA